MYEPEVNDYVIWTTELGQIHEGWVYFKAEPVIPKRGWVTPQRYITIEIGIKEKPDYQEDNFHRYIHTLLCCYAVSYTHLRAHET